jgi:hypothetical protein
LLVVAVLSLACHRAPKNEEAIRQGVIDHLKNKKFDLSAMTVEVTKVTYRGDEADAVVAFKPKNMPEAGMSMDYKLENRSGRWEVKERPASGMGQSPHGAAPAEGAASGQAGQPQLPPGHPPTTGAAGQGGQQQLPPGHPPVAPAKPETGSTKPRSTATTK